jgi:predicted nucleic acid-binding protein
VADLVVDTDILIDVGRGVSEAVAYLQDAERLSTLAVSTVTQMELFIGCRNKRELGEIEKFLRRFQVIKLSEVISDTAVALLKQYRLSHNLLIPDALIAATALSLDAPLASKNQRDFRFINGLKLQGYP